LAVVVDEDVLWLDVARCVQESAPETLESVELLDVYRGEPVPTGRKSVAFSLTFRRSGRTITAEDAEQGRSAILEALREKLGAELR
jgi:phenylalanyl-tRNA synthetase beta chain